MARRSTSLRSVAATRWLESSRVPYTRTRNAFVVAHGYAVRMHGA
ncbi:hypothetical protein [Halohasta litchfieldiae]|nr:hypothetical protein [Halohasta litchfieldiae]